MKNLIILLLIFFLVNETVQSQNSCPTYPSTWTQRLKGTYKTWSIDDNSISNVVIDGVQSSGNVEKVRSAIRSTISKWRSAIDNQITFVELSSQNLADANIIFYFNLCADYWGFAPDTNSIYLGFTEINPANQCGPGIPPMYWTSMGQVNNYTADLETIILHEFGHILLGGDHYDTNPNSVMKSGDRGNPIVRRNLHFCDIEIVRNFYNPNIDVTVYNSFNGGEVEVNSNRVPSGSNFPWLKNTFPHRIKAIDQNFTENGINYFRLFNFWRDKDGNRTYEREKILSPVENVMTFTADFKKRFDVTVQNLFAGVGNFGVIKVNNVQHNLPQSPIHVIQDNSLSLEAIDQLYNGINYTFNQWSDQGGLNKIWDLIPYDHKTCTAYFSGAPQPPTIAFNLTQNQPIRFTWTSNPNSNVTYQVWRDIYHKATGWTHGWHQIATLPSGSNSYTDGDYIYGWGSNSYDLFYKIKAVYSVENTTNWSNFIGTTGLDNEPLGKQSLSIPSEYGITSFPNPFNPATTLLYKLVDDSNVELEIYDITGKLVDKLVKEQKQAGYHSVIWNTSNINGEKLSSGMYIYRFTAKPINGNNIYIKTDKLILMK